MGGFELNGEGRRGGGGGGRTLVSRAAIEIRAAGLQHSFIGREMASGIQQQCVSVPLRTPHFLLVSGGSQREVRLPFGLG